MLDKVASSSLADALDIAKKALALSILGLSLICSERAEAADYPNKPVHIIVPYSPGGGADTMTRIIAQKLSDIWKQPVIIDNKPGAGTVLGAGFVAKSPADGYTILMSSAALLISPLMYANLPYDVNKDFTAVTMLDVAPDTIAVGPSHDFHSVDELVAFAKANPEKINLASPGTGTLSDLVGKLFEQQAGIKAKEVPYRGSEPALVALASGEVDVAFDVPASMSPFTSDGKVRILAVTTKDRYKTLPNVPTLQESGLKGFDVSVWNGFFVPGKTPRNIIDAIASVTKQALEDPDVKSRIEETGFDIWATTPEETAKIVERDSKRWLEAGKAAGIQPQ